MLFSVVDEKGFYELAMYANRVATIVHLVFFGIALAQGSDRDAEGTDLNPSESFFFTAGLLYTPRGSLLRSPLKLILFVCFIARQGSSYAYGGGATTCCTPDGTTFFRVRVVFTVVALVHLFSSSFFFLIAWPAVRKTGICASTNDLVYMCPDLEMARSKDCMGENGPWCCYCKVSVP